MIVLLHLKTTKLLSKGGRVHDAAVTLGQRSASEMGKHSKKIGKHKAEEAASVLGKRAHSKRGK